MFFGGLKRDRQYFDRTAATAQSSMLLLAAAALVMPAIFELVDGRGLPQPGDEAVDYDTTVECCPPWWRAMLMPPTWRGCGSP